MNVVLAAVPAPIQRPRINWIISAPQDLTWFIGSSLVGFAAIALLASGFPLLPLQIVWAFGVDGPHVVATITRTYADRAERQRLGSFVWIVVPLLLVGPLMAWLGYGALFFLAAFCWQQMHVTKQHVGFAMIYKAKHERSPFDRALDRWFLLVSLWAPLGLFIAATQFKHPLSGPAPLIPAVLLAYAAFTAVWLGRQVYKWRAGDEMNWPKVALFAVVVPLQWLAFGFARRFGPIGTLYAALPLGLFHGLQYHRLLWFHNHNRYADPEAVTRHGLAARLASNVWVYVAVALGLNFALSFVLPRVMRPLPGSSFEQMLQAALWGIAFTHYCLDARIWRVREDKGLATALRLA